MAPVVIIGGGFAGLSTAYWLAKAGVQGVLLERESEVARHASGKNAGLFRQLCEDSLIGRLAKQSREFFIHAPMFTQTGSLLLYHDPAEAHFSYMPEQDYCRLASTKAKAKFAVLEDLDFHVAYHCPSDGLVSQEGLADFYFREATKTFDIVCNAKVQKIDRLPNAFEITTDQVGYKAESIFNAAGAWAAEVAHSISPSIELQPYKRHLFVMEGTSKVRGPQPYVWHQQEGYYYRTWGQRHQNILLSISDKLATSASDQSIEPAIFDQLEQKISRTLSFLSQKKHPQTWSCLRTYSVDGRPIVGQDLKDDRFFWVAGLAGFGLTLSPVLGKLAADLYLGKSVDGDIARACSPQRFL